MSEPIRHPFNSGSTEGACFECRKPRAAHMPSVSVGDDDEKEETYGVLIRVPSGVLFETQAGGIACHHPFDEGVFVPFPGTQVPHVGCWGDVPDEDWNEMALAIAALPLKLDESRRREAQEAWWPVVVTQAANPYDTLASFAGATGWLITGNCD